MWSVVQAAATAKPTPIKTLVAAGMNEVLDSAGYTQAAWWNRIPVSAWSLMAIIAVCSNVMIGYGFDRKTHLPSHRSAVCPLCRVLTYCGD